MLTAQVTGTSNSIVRERYLTVSVVKRNADEARSYFARVGTDLVTHLAQLSTLRCNGRCRLRVQLPRNLATGLTPSPAR